MNRNFCAMLLAVLLLFACTAAGASAESNPVSAGQQPTETISYQYNANGNPEAVTVETEFPDGTFKTTVTILDPVLQLPVSEDTVILSGDGSRETVNVVYTRDASGNLLERTSITFEKDGSELKDVITNNSYGSNTFRKTEWFDRTGSLLMSEEISYIYSEENVLLQSLQESYQQNGHNIKTVITYDETGKNPVEATTDYSYADGSSGTVTRVFEREAQSASAEEESVSGSAA